MKRSNRSHWAFGVLGVAMVVPMTIAAARTTHSATPKPKGAGGGQAATADEQLRAKLATAPLGFELNKGQTSRENRFLARTQDGILLMRPDRITLGLRKPVKRLPRTSPKAGTERPTITALQMKLVNARASAQMRGEERLPGNANYFIGRDPSKWLTDVPTYRKVRYDDIYKGVDLVCYGNGSQLEYDFVVSPGQDPGRIKMAYEGADAISVDRDGDLVIRTAAGDVEHKKPVAYQEVAGRRLPVEASYVLAANNAGAKTVGFELGSYRKDVPLVIDPIQMIYSTYLGGNNDDRGRAIDHDSSGNAFVTGKTVSGNFPMVGAYDNSLGVEDLFITKYSPDGQTMLFSTYYGGSNNEDSSSIVVDSSGNPIVCGYTASSTFVTFPTSGPNAVVSPFSSGPWDGYVLKLNSTGNSLIWSTLLAKNGDDRCYDVAVDSSNNVYLTGRTGSSNWFITANARQSTQPGLGNNYDGFFIKLNSNVTSVLYSTYVGGNADEQCNSVAVDPSGNAYVIGQTTSSNLPTTVGAFQTARAGINGTYDAFVAKYIPTAGTSAGSLGYMTYIGGSNNDYGYGIGVDTSGQAYICGTTNSTNYPTGVAAYSLFTGYRGGVTDAFITKFNAAGSSLLYSTYMGGTQADEGTTIVVDKIGNVYMGGSTGSARKKPSNTFGLPMVVPIQNEVSLNTDLYMVKLRKAGTGPIFSTYLGGAAYEVASGLEVDLDGNAYMTGYTTSTGFPTFHPYQSVYGGNPYDAVVAKFQLNDPPTFETPQPQSVSIACSELPKSYTWSLDVKDVNSDDLQVTWSVKTPGAGSFTTIDTDHIDGPPVDLSTDPVVLTPTTGTATLNPDYSVTTVGTYTFQATLTDGLKDVVYEWTVTVTDTVPPSFTAAVAGDLGTLYLNPTNAPDCDRFEGLVPIPAVTDCDPNPTITGTIPDPNPSVNNGNPAIADTTEFPITLTSSSHSIYQNIGETYVVTWTATDWLSNSANATQTLIVADVTAPVLNIPGDVTVPADLGQEGAELDTTELKITPSGYSATDNCGMATVIAFRDNPWTHGESDADDGIPEHLDGFYPLGRSLITWIAYDESLNYTELYQEVYVEGSTTISSPFTASDENWTTYGTDVTAVSYSATGGNPGGFICASQPSATSSTWFFEAPSKFHGNMSGAYGQTLTFDLKLNGTANVSSDEGVILAGGGLTIYAPLGSTPTTSWGGQSVTLSTSTGWKVDDGDGNLGNDVLATNGNIQDVLGSLTSLKIRGKFITTAGAKTSLDNVVLNLNYLDPTPTPSFRRPEEPNTGTDKNTKKKNTKKSTKKNKSSKKSKK